VGSTPTHGTKAKRNIMIATDLKTGTIFKMNNQPYIVMKYEHIKVGRGSASVKIRMKNIITGQVMDKGCVSTEKFEDAEVNRKNAQYLYKDKDYVFMDPDTYEQFNISADLLGASAKFLLEGQNIQVQYFEGKPILVDLPISMVFEVTYTEPGFKGNTVSNVLKDATLNTGAVVKVPTFVKIGDKIKIDTRDGSYSSKA
jgi:elongation factor P